MLISVSSTTCISIFLFPSGWDASSLNPYLPETSYAQRSKMCYSILVVTLLKEQLHYSQSSNQNRTPSSGISPSAYYKEEPPPLTSSSLKLLIKNINFSQALVSHDSKLPDDVITPVLPPILPSPSFPLPRIQRVQRGGSLENPSTSQGAVSTPIHFYKMIYCGNFEKPSRSV